MITLRSNRIYFTLSVLILMTLACQFFTRPRSTGPDSLQPTQSTEPTVQNSLQPTRSTEPTLQNSIQPTESTAPVDSQVNTQGVSFDIIPYAIQDRPDDFVRPGYKYIDIYVAIKNTGTDWVYFNGIDSFKPMKLKTDGGDYDSVRRNSTDQFLSAPGTTVTGIGNDWFYLEFEIGATLKPISIELQYSYSLIDEYGITISSPSVYLGPITLDLQNLSNLAGVPFAQEMVVSTLPVTYELPKGVVNINSVNQDSAFTNVDFSVTSSDPAQDIDAYFTVVALTKDGLIFNYSFDKLVTSITVGPMLTLNQKFKFYSIPPNSEPIYFIVYGIYIEDDSQIVKQVIKIIP